MSNLIYFAIASLDGYVNDEQGEFGWAAPNEETHQFVNDLVRDAGTFLYGRRMYEVMSVWDADENFPEPSPAIRDFAGIWRAADKIVYSTRLASVHTSSTQLERSFEPNNVRQLKASATRNMLIGGPGIAAHAFAAGLIDECQLLLVPIIVGGGTSVFPDRVRVELELLDERHFSNGMVYLHYRRKA